ncbi:MAG: HEAT repeat domain-containing protein [Chloroflexi bacterium]|nr:HEAT repeat domain-containing protein [Chloroflexota bacterium]
MEEEKKQPFSEVLDAVFDEELVHIYLLHRFSDMSNQEFDQLKSHWAKADDEKRRVITQHLVDIGEYNFVVDFSPIFSFCLQDEFAAVRIAALDGLWDDTTVSLISTIVGLLKHDLNEGVRTAAARALAHYIVLAEWEELPMTAVTPALETLLAVYDDSETPFSIKRAALESLGSSSHKRLPDLIRDAYEQDAHEMQISAVFAMGNSADKQWTSIIIDEMDSHSEDMRAEAARAAGSIGSSDAVPELAELIMDEDKDVRLAAVVALGAIGGDIPQRLLTEILEDEEQEDLHEVADEVLEEMIMFGAELDLLDIFDPDNDSE